MSYWIPDCSGMTGRFTTETRRSQSSILEKPLSDFIKCDKGYQKYRSERFRFKDQSSTCSIFFENA